MAKKIALVIGLTLFAVVVLYGPDIVEYVLSWLVDKLMSEFSDTDTIQVIETLSQHT